MNESIELKPALTITAHQLRAALEFAAPDFDTEPEQLETHVSIGWASEGATCDDDGKPDPAGLRV